MMPMAADPRAHKNVSFVGGLPAMFAWNKGISGG